jgi:hypothetical protein
MDSGIAIRAIYQLGSLSNTVYILPVANSPDETPILSPPLSRSQIAALDECPPGDIDSGGSRQSALETVTRPATQSSQGVTVKPHWCSEQSRFTDFETAICSNPLLSQLDIQMESIYYPLIQSRSGSARETIQTTQKLLVQQRTLCGSNLIMSQTIV